MPIHDLGYRVWEGRAQKQVSRWLVIAQTGIRLSWKNLWLRRILFLAWFPAAYLGLGFFLYEQTQNNSEPARRAIRGLLLAFRNAGPVSEALQAGAFSVRHQFWALMLMVFFRYLQSVAMVLLVGMIAPPLITQDIRSKGFLLYFCRPLSAFEYVLGKAAIIWAYLALITILPGLALYALGVMLSPDLSVVAFTWDLPLRIVAASLVMMIPTTVLALMFSSMTSESRYAGFAWFTIWILGWVAYGTMTSVSPRRNWSALSLYHTLGKVQSWVFGLSTFNGEVQAAAILLVALTCGAFVVLMRRVSAPMQI